MAKNETDAKKVVGGADKILDENQNNAGPGNSGNEGGQGEPGSSGNNDGEGEGSTSATGKSGKGSKAKGGKEGEGDMVMVSRTDLQALMKKLDDQAADIKVLYKVADKGRLDRFDPSGKEAALIKTVRPWFFEGKLVIASKLVSNVGDVINGKSFEDQKLLVIFEDGESKEMRYRDFEVHKEYRKAEITGKRIESVKNDKGEDVEELFFKVQFPDGKKIELSANSVN